MSRGTIFIGAIFAIALAIVVGNRLSNDALTVLVGALCGLTASVPITIALVIALKQNWGQPQVQREEYSARPYMQQPPVVVISPPQNATPSPYGIAPSQLYLPANVPPPGAPRDFKIIGED